MCILCHHSFPIYRAVLTEFTIEVKLCPWTESKELSLLIYSGEDLAFNYFFLDDSINIKNKGKYMDNITKANLSIPGSVSDPQAKYL